MIKTIKHRIPAIKRFHSNIKIDPNFFIDKLKIEKGDIPISNYISTDINHNWPHKFSFEELSKMNKERELNEQKIVEEE